MAELSMDKQERDSVVNEVDDVNNDGISPVPGKKEGIPSAAVKVENGTQAEAIPKKTDQMAKTYGNATEKENKPVENTAVEKKVISSIADDPAFVSKDVEADKQCNMSLVKSESELEMEVNENKILTEEEPARVPCEVNKNLINIVDDVVGLTVKKQKKVISEGNGVTGDEDVAKLTAENITPADISAPSSQTKMISGKESLTVWSATKSGQESAIRDKLLNFGSQSDEVSSERTQEAVNVNSLSSKVQQDLESEQTCVENPIEMKRMDTAVDEDHHDGKQKQSDFSRDSQENTITEAVPRTAETVPSIELQSSETKNMNLEKTGQNSEIKKTPATEGSSAEMETEVENEPAEKIGRKIEVSPEPRVGGDGKELGKLVSTVNRERTELSSGNAISLEVSKKLRAEQKSDDTERIEKNVERNTEIKGLQKKLKDLPKQSRFHDVAKKQGRGKKIGENNLTNHSTFDRQNCDDTSEKNQVRDRNPVLANKREESINELQQNLKSSRNKAANPTAKVSGIRRVIAKPRGKAKGKVGSIPRRSHIATPNAVQVTSSEDVHLTTPKGSSESRMIRKMGRRGSSGTSIRESEKDRRQKRRKVEERKNDLQHLQASNSHFRRRIKNVKSKLFSETKSFRAYKSARQEEKLQRSKKRTSKQTELRYADRSIDFNKKSKRQHVSRRNDTVAG